MRNLVRGVVLAPRVVRKDSAATAPSTEPRTRQEVGVQPFIGIGTVNFMKLQCLLAEDMMWFVSAWIVR